MKSLSTFSEASEKGFGDIESVLYSEMSFVVRCPTHSEGRGSMV